MHMLGVTSCLDGPRSCDSSTVDFTTNNHCEFSPFTDHASNHVKAEGFDPFYILWDAEKFYMPCDNWESLESHPYFL